MPTRRRKIPKQGTLAKFSFTRSTRQAQDGAGSPAPSFSPDVRQLPQRDARPHSTGFPRRSSSDPELHRETSPQPSGVRSRPGSASSPRTAGDTQRGAIQDSHAPASPASASASGPPSSYSSTGEREEVTTADKFLDRHGNNAAKAKYEAHIPIYYYRPTHADCHVLREQWIRAKYERKQFMKKEGSDGFAGGVKEGTLFKRGRDNGQYMARKFVLTEIDGTLKYFIKSDAKEPKAVIKIDSINAIFQPEKMKHSNGLQITYIKDNKARNLFVYHNDGQEIVSWFNAIRAAQFHYMKVAFPTASDKEILSRLPKNFLREGYMEKTGPKPTDAFKRRWFTLDHRRLMYFKDPLDAFAKGQVFLGSSENGYQVKAEMVPSSHGNMWNYGISISTPERNYMFTCESEQERENWLSVFKKVISIPMTVREYAVEAQFKHRS